jgi:Tfp pilus assembly protein PilO
MNLPKNYFENLSATKYREYLKLLPNIHQETTRNFVTLALTFAALSFFGIFAINPTLSTIFDLRKQLADDVSANQQLQTKINNLSSLQQQYTQLGSNLTNIYSAVPQNPQAPLLSAQIAALGQKHTITLTSYRVSEVELASTPKDAKIQSFTFTLQAEGSYTNMLSFSTELTRLTRLLTVESIEIGKDTKSDNLVLTLRGRGYFKQ